MFLTQPPVLLETPENSAATREAYDTTAELRRSGVIGFVLMRLTVARDGTVESARAILPPKLPLVHASVVTIDATTGEEFPPPPPHTLQPDLCHAAETAARRLKFRPATRLGRPVRYHGYRHGFSFDVD